MATPRKPAPRSSGSRPRPQSRTASPNVSRPARASGARAESGARAPTSAPPKRPAKPGPPPVLTTKQRCHLRGLGHHLTPVVQVGKEGVTDPLCQAIGVALHCHELIKLRLAESVEGDRHTLAAEVAARCHAALVQVLGRTFLLYRPRPADDGDDARGQRPHVSLH